MTSLNRKPVVADRRIDAAARAVPCAFCQHANPSDSRYCNRCGAPLAAAPCHVCGTISDAGAHACKTCGADLGDRDGDTLFQPLPPAFKPGLAPAANREPPEPVPSWDTPLFILDPPGPLVPGRDAASAPAGDAVAAPRTPTGGLNKAVIGAAAILAVMGAVALLVSRHDARDESSGPAAASGAVTVAPAPPEPASAPPAAPKIDTTPASAAPVRASAAPAAAAPRPRTDTTPPPARSTVETAPAVAPPAARIGPCTEAVAALGLCTLPAAPAKER